jgi:uncharacterized membrane protein
MRTQRLEAFSDGVFAIAATLLVLEIAIPTTPQLDLRTFLGEWPSYLSYLVSFATIGGVWLGHSLITEYLHRSDAILVRLNLLLLLVVSFLPFPTHLLAQFVGAGTSERVAVTIYGLNLLLATGLLIVLWQYALRERLVRPDADDAELATLTRRLTPGLAGYVVLLVLGLFFPGPVIFGYLLLELYFIIPSGRHLRRRTAPTPSNRARLRD